MNNNQWIKLIEFILLRILKCKKINKTKIIIIILTIIVFYLKKEIIGKCDHNGTLRDTIDNILIQVFPQYCKDIIEMWL